MRRREKITFLADSYWLGMVLLMMALLFGMIAYVIGGISYDYYYQVPLRDGGYRDLQDVIYAWLFLESLISP